MSTPNEINLEIKKLMNNLTKFTRERPDRILDDRQCYLSLLNIYNIIEKKHELIDFDVFAKNRFDQVIANYLKELFKVRMSIDFQTKFIFNDAQVAASERNEVLVKTLLCVNTIANVISLRSVEICSLFVEHECLQLWLEFLKDELFLNKNKDAGFELSGVYESVIDNFLMNISLLALASCDEQKHKWKSLNAATILLNVADVNQSTRSNSFNALALLLDDKQIEALFEQNKMKLILDSILEYVIQTSVNFNMNMFERRTFEIKFKGKPIKCEIHYEFDENGRAKFIHGVLQRLYKLSVNDSIKLAIYFDANIKEGLKTILEKGKLFLFEY